MKGIILEFLINLFHPVYIWIGSKVILSVSPVCAVLNGNIEPDCDYPVQSGVDDTLYLINKSEIASVTRNGTNPQIIEDIVLVSGATAFTVQGQNNSNNTKWEAAPLKYVNMFNHFVDFIGFDLSPTGYLRYEELAKGEVVAVVVNKYRGDSGNAAIKIYGLDAGLRMASMGQDMSSEETQGAVSISLATKAPNYEPHTPAALFDTDYATSLAIIEGLAA